MNKASSFLKLIFLYLIMFKQLSGQNIDSLGVDNSNLLNTEEVKYLEIFMKPIDSWTLKNKKIAFITGNSGNKLVNKIFFFNHYIKPCLKKNKKPAIMIIYLNHEEIKKSNGYEVLVLVWVKYFSNKNRSRILKDLGALY